MRVFRSRRTLVAVAAITSMLAGASAALASDTYASTSTAPASPTSARGLGAIPTPGRVLQPVCPKVPDTPKTMTCNLIMALSEGQNLAGTPTPSAGVTPAQIAQMYHVPATTSNAQRVAIIIPGHQPDLEGVLAHYRATFHLPSCTTLTIAKDGKACLRFLTAPRDSTPTQTAASDQQVQPYTTVLESDLDVQAVTAACPLCPIDLIETTAFASDGALAMQYASKIDKVVTSSWSWPEDGQVTDTDAILTPAAGSSVFGVYGDGGYEGAYHYPTAVSGVIAVGSTTYRDYINNGDQGPFGKATAWNGSGAFCYADVPVPSFQLKAATGCTGRGAMDVATLGDPAVGLATYTDFGAGSFTLPNGTTITETAVGTWKQLGGQSLSAPLMAGLIAGQGLGGVVTNDRLYALAASGALYARGAFIDVTKGNNTCGLGKTCLNSPTTGPDSFTSNGDTTCRDADDASATDPICYARKGWDGPTGLGTLGDVTRLRRLLLS